MTDILFVCYHHGCRGERLAVNLSKHEHFTTLYADEVGGRTNIKNEYFNKQFLQSWTPPIHNLKNLSGGNIVVPSHFYYDTLKEHFPDAMYVAIDMPKDVQSYRQSLYERFYQYKTNNMAELVGYCESKMRDFDPEVTQDEINNFTKKVLRLKDLTFGDIRCMVKGLEPTRENKMKLLEQHTPIPLSAETKTNSLVIAYEDVNKVDRDKVMSHFISS